MVGKYRFRRILLVAGSTLLLGTAGVSRPLVVSAASASASGSFNQPGDLLISDQFNNRAAEINPATKQVVWSFGSGNPTRCDPGPGSIIGLNDAERLSDGLTLLAGTGIPAGSSPVAPGFSCVDNRVIVVNHDGDIVWQYGRAGVTGSGANQLNVPVFAIQLPNRNILIVDQGNNRVIEVGRFTKKVVWSYGPTSGPGALNNPNSAELLPGGHVLIADENNNRVIEITRDGRIVWQYGSGSPTDTAPLHFAAFASRLPNGDTLITDSGHSRIVEVTEDKHVVFQYFTNHGNNSNSSPLPTNAVRLANGDMAIADQFNHRAITIGADKHLEFQYGSTNVPGNTAGLLDGPYTAFAVGDYTGQTPPPAVF